ncbi:TPA: P27 family phage terminase small subunit [Bacillus cereus]|uniref:P27 family phage terminase small subunit n=1 Tax=Bacillus cereus TaxID=1396 RepID=UPI0019277D59|nr:P27 family phage terminase small subunit [Bacillus cereus]MBL3768863.1 P27 family phage terminase small subunit [Bacillus cereus]MBL3774705.1 P27 family phage terminase small subunit [Bacillus cereus]MBL3780471.1 P27 family phage terminase small subunit [Bacillus cereus]MBL3791736.1 P27 family phage terminase small subunit [Bacillus cereus]
MRKLSKKAQIKQDLLQQLEMNGLYGMHYIDLVDDYITMFDVKNKLAREMKKNGPMIEWQNSESQKGIKANPATKEFRETNKRMTELLKVLGLKEPIAIEGDDDDDI